MTLTLDKFSVKILTLSEKFHHLRNTVIQSSKEVSLWIFKHSLSLKAQFIPQIFSVLSFELFRAPNHLNVWSICVEVAWKECRDKPLTYL
jgi:hypothetical protein